MRHVALVMLAACAAAPLERPRAPRRGPRPEAAHAHAHAPPAPGTYEPRDVEIAAERPAVALPAPPAPVKPAFDRDALLEHLRWPRSQTSHPVLEPAFAIAATLAQPGVAWTDLCAMGAQNRTGINRDHLEYLRAWCDVAKRDVRGAATRLGPLLHATTAGISAAARMDLANILVDAGGSEAAALVLRDAHIDDVGVYDLLAATYAEVGNGDGALELTERALGSETDTDDAAHCERRTRQILLHSGEYQHDLMRAFARERHPACQELAHSLLCMGRQPGCTPAENMTFQLLRAAYTGWPSGPAAPGTWWTIAAAALPAIAVPGADRLALGALEAMVRGLRCTDPRLGEAVAAAAELFTDPRHDAGLDTRLRAILWTPEQLCRR